MFNIFDSNIDVLWRTRKMQNYDAPMDRDELVIAEGSDLVNLLGVQRTRRMMWDSSITQDLGLDGEDAMFDPTSGSPSQDQFTGKLRSYKSTHVFRLGDGGCRTYADLISYATATTTGSFGVLGPKIDYRGKVIPALVAEMYEAKSSESDITLTLLKVDLLERLGGSMYSPEMTRELLTRGLKHGLTPEQSIRFIRGEKAHVDERRTREVARNLETLYDEMSEPSRNRPIEPHARKYDQKGR